MRQIRIGKDIKLKWSITTNGEALPLEGRDLKLVMHTPQRKDVDMEFEIQDTNVVVFTYYGIDHDVIGIHSLTLWENYDKHGETAVDHVNAFALVPTTNKENPLDNQGCGNLDYEVIELDDSNLQLGVQGKDGVGIQSIEQITSPTESEGENVIRVTLTNDETQDFVVRNGKQGEQGIQGAQGEQGKGFELVVDWGATPQSKWNQFSASGATANFPLYTPQQCRVDDLFVVVGTVQETGQTKCLVYKSITPTQGVLRGTYQYSIDGGIQGIQGEKGEKGDKGEKGEQGVQGIEGPMGKTMPTKDVASIGDPNNMLETGVYAYEWIDSLGIEAGRYDVFVEKSSTADPSGYYAIKQTFSNREKKIGYMRVIFRKEDPTDHPSDNPVVEILDRDKFTSINIYDYMPDGELYGELMPADAQYYYLLIQTEGVNWLPHHRICINESGNAELVFCALHGGNTGAIYIVFTYVQKNEKNFWEYKDDYTEHVPQYILIAFGECISSTQVVYGNYNQDIINETLLSNNSRYEKSIYLTKNSPDNAYGLYKNRIWEEDLRNNGIKYFKTAGGDVVLDDDTYNRLIFSDRIYNLYKTGEAYFNVLGAWYSINIRSLINFPKGTNEKIPNDTHIAIKREDKDAGEFFEQYIDFASIEIPDFTFQTFKATKGYAGKSDGEFIKYMLVSGQVYSAPSDPNNGCIANSLASSGKVTTYDFQALDYYGTFPTKEVAQTGVNPDNLLETGVYAYERIEGYNDIVDGRYDIFVQRSTSCDGNGYYAIKQTLYNRNDKKCYTRALFRKSNATDAPLNNPFIQVVDASEMNSFYEEYSNFTKDVSQFAEYIDTRIKEAKEAIENLAKAIDEKQCAEFAENFVINNRVFIGGAYLDDVGNLYLPTAEYNEEDKSITIK